MAGERASPLQRRRVTQRLQLQPASLTLSSAASDGRSSSGRPRTRLSLKRRSETVQEEVAAATGLEKERSLSEEDRATPIASGGATGSGSGRTKSTRVRSSKEGLPSPAPAAVPLAAAQMSGSTDRPPLSRASLKRRAEALTPDPVAGLESVGADGHPNTSKALVGTAQERLDVTGRCAAKPSRESQPPSSREQEIDGRTPQTSARLIARPKLRRRAEVLPQDEGLSMVGLAGHDNANVVPESQVPSSPSGIRLIRDMAPKKACWRYSLADAGRKSYIGLLARAVPDHYADKMFAVAKHAVRWQEAPPELGGPGARQSSSSTSPPNRKTAWFVKPQCLCAYHDLEAVPYPEWLIELMAECMPLCGLREQSSWPTCCLAQFCEAGVGTTQWNCKGETLFEQSAATPLKGQRLAIGLALGSPRSLCFRSALDASEQQQQEWRTVRLGVGSLCSLEGLVHEQYDFCRPSEPEDEHGTHIMLTWRFIGSHQSHCPHGSQEVDHRSTPRPAALAPQQSAQLHAAEPMIVDLTGGVVLTPAAKRCKQDQAALAAQRRAAPGSKSRSHESQSSNSCQCYRRQREEATNQLQTKGGGHGGRPASSQIGRGAAPLSSAAQTGHVVPCASSQEHKSVAKEAIREASPSFKVGMKTKAKCEPDASSNAPTTQSTVRLRKAANVSDKGDVEKRWTAHDTRVLSQPKEDRRKSTPMSQAKGIMKGVDPAGGVKIEEDTLQDIRPAGASIQHDRSSSHSDSENSVASGTAVKAEQQADAGAPMSDVDAPPGVWDDLPCRRRGPTRDGRAAWQ